MNLPTSLLAAPIAHRGLHDLSAGRAENSIKAFEAAIAHGYGIELDLQLSKDGVAMVFHDYELSRLTDESGAVAQHDVDELATIALKGDGDGIPTLKDVLDFVDGRVPLLIELKDQDGILGPNVGALEQQTAELLRAYQGVVAVMSFNPYSVLALGEYAPDVPRGLVTAAYDFKSWPTIPQARRDELRKIPDYALTQSCFISHEAEDLDRERVMELKNEGATILCWTIKSQSEEKQARKIVDNVTFEGYLA